ncbi:MOSC domain-containing protein [Hymenobacter puniceus]|uniref:MOSC domain-containing protein n=1 Tax=Hymenobacter sp. BT190 TaxID=2763505 RepID=UPI0016519F44|nr:MOSC domain-containing protein [Hymenobacter sp. BT190]MBC6700128.1 MOSC domain-containing protein [Hymenobacter sp. BT190]
MKQLLSVQVGQPRTVAWQGRWVSTGVFKAPVAEPVAVGPVGLAGDGQADLRVHGGPDKAVYAYAAEHYSYWAEQLVGAMPSGAGVFGENLTTTGLLERDVCLGDEFAIGSAVLRAVQPRMPCFKLGIRFNDAGMVARFAAAGRSGIYFQVLREGTLQAGDPIHLVQRSAYALSIQEVADLYYGVTQDLAAIRLLLSMPLVPELLKSQFAHRFHHAL